MDDGHTRSPRPRGKRPSRWMIPGLIVLSLLAILLLGPLFLMSIAPVREWVLTSAPLRQGLGEGVRLNIEDVERLDVAGVSLRGVELQVRDTQGVWQQVIRAPRLSATWSVPDILLGKVLIHSIEATPLSVSLDGIARMRVARDGEQPDRKAGGAGLPAWLMRVSVEHLHIGPFEVSDSSATVVRGDLSCSQIDASDGSVRFLLHEAWVAAAHRGLHLTLREGWLRWWEGRVGLHGISLDGPRVRGTATALYDPQHPDSQLQLDLVLDRLDPVLLTEYFLPTLDLMPGDSLSGRVGISRSQGTTRFDLDLAGVLLEEQLSELNAQLMLGEGALRVDDLVIRGEVGEVTGRGLWDSSSRRADLNLRWDRLDHGSAWLPWLRSLPLDEPFAGSGEATVIVPDGKPVVVEGSLELRRVSFWDIPARRILFRGSVETGSAIRAEELCIIFSSGEMRATGDWPLGEGEVGISVQLDSIPLSVLRESWRAGIRGRVSGDLRLAGLPEDPMVEGVLRATHLSRGSWSVETLKAGSLLLWPRDQRGDGVLELQGLRHGEGPPCWLSARFSRWNRWLSFATSVRMAAADLHLEGRLDPEGSLEVNQGSASLRYMEDWTLDRPFHMTWGGGTLTTDSLCLASGSARLSGAGQWTGSSGEIDAGLMLQAFDASVLRSWLGHSQQVRGQCNLRLDARGDLPDPELSVHFEGDSVAWGPVDLGRIALDASWSDSALAIGPVTLESRQQVVHMRSLLVHAGAPLLSLLERNSSAGAPDSKQVAIENAPWSGQLQIDRLDLARWAPLLGLKGHADEDSLQRVFEVKCAIGGRLVPIRVEAPWELGPGDTGTGEMGGTLGATISVSGTPRKPVLEMEAIAEELTLARVPLGTLLVSIAYADSSIALSRLELSDGEQASSVGGLYPFVIQMLPLRAGRLDRPVDMRADLVDFNLRLLSGFTKWLPDARGRLSGNLITEGTGLHPGLRGKLQLRDGGFRIPGRSERIRDVEAEATLGPGGLVLQSLTASSGPRGTLTAWGTVAGTGEFDLMMRAQRLRIFQEGSYDFEISVDSLRAYAHRTAGGEKAAPHLRGSVRVLQGTYWPDLSEGGSSRRSGKGLEWVIDLDLAVPGNVRISQTNAKVDVGNGVLQLAYRQPYWNVSGDLEVLGGTYRLFHNMFAVTGGSVEFLDTGTGPDVVVDVDGETRARAAVDEEATEQDFTIAIRVYGKPDDLQTNLTSTPSLSREEILELLVYERYGIASRDAETQRQYLFNKQTEGILFNEMIERVERGLAEQIPALSGVVVQAPTSEEDPWKVRLEQMITPGVEFTGSYSRQIAEGANAWEFTVDYRLTRNLLLRVSSTYELEGTQEHRNHVDLKFRHEY